MSKCKFQLNMGIHRPEILIMLVSVNAKINFMIEYVNGSQSCNVE